MKKKALVLSVEGNKLILTVSGNGDSAEPIAACCVVPSQKFEVKNIIELGLKPGDEVWITDGLGTMLGSGAAFLAFPVILYGLGLFLFLSQTMAWIGGVLGLFLACLNFWAQRLSQYPKVTGRVSNDFTEDPEIHPVNG